MEDSNEIRRERIIRYENVDVSTSRNEKSDSVNVDIAIDKNLYAAYHIIHVFDEQSDEDADTELRIIHNAVLNAIKATAGMKGVYQHEFTLSLDPLVRKYLERVGYTSTVLQTVIPVWMSEHQVKRLKECMPISHVGESSSAQLLSVYSFCDALSSNADKFDLDSRRIINAIKTNVPDAVRLLTEVKVKSTIGTDTSKDIIDFNEKCMDIIRLRLLRDKGIKDGNIPCDIAVDFTCGSYGYPIRIKLLSSMVYECVDTIIGVLVRELKQFSDCDDEALHKVINESLEFLRYY